MPEEVRDAPFYHLNRNANGSRYALMLTGDRLSVGAEPNPFFSFYDGNLEMVTVNTPAGPTQYPAWVYVQHVNAGTITPSDQFKRIAHNVANHYAMLARELVWENVRLAEFPGEPSRQRCLFLVRSLPELAIWMGILKHGAEVPQIVRVRATGRVREADAALLACLSKPLPVWHDNARKYWRGEVSENPQLETLFEGDLVVDEHVDPAIVAAQTR